MCNKSFQEKFVKGVHQLVTQYLSDGRQKVLQNYMIWRVVASFYPDQPSEEYHRYGVSIRLNNGPLFQRGFNFCKFDVPTKGGFFSESAICFFKSPNLQKKYIPKNYPALEI